MVHKPTIFHCDHQFHLMLGGWYLTSYEMLLTNTLNKNVSPVQTWEVANKIKSHRASFFHQQALAFWPIFFTCGGNAFRLEIFKAKS